MTTFVCVRSIRGAIRLGGQTTRRRLIQIVDSFERPMAPDDSVTLWITRLKRGYALAAQEIWNRYFAQLVRQARRKLDPIPRRAADEEDVALSAFRSFCTGVDEGRFPQLNDRHDLWRVLVTITARKAVALLRREHRRKRGGGRIRGESIFVQPDDSQGEQGIAQVLGDEPTPEFAAQVAEEYQRLLVSLDDDALRQIAVWKMEGWSTQEICEKLGCSTRTVERKLERIRAIWQENEP